MYVNRPNEISAIDGKMYCVKNGKFTRHLREHNISYEEYCITYKGMVKQLCPFCGSGCSFSHHSETYRQVCGNQDCINKMISQAKQNFTDEKWERQRERRKETMHTKYTVEDIQEMNRRGKETARLNNVYDKAVERRRETCLKRYGNPLFNNSTQITKSKLNWSTSRKNLFLSRLYVALGNRTLTEYRDEFASDWRLKRKRTRVQRGLEMSHNLIKSFKQYSRIVRCLTDTVYKNNKHIINPKNLPRVSASIGKQRGGYQVDHIISVKHGFLNNIPPHVIADVSNLQMLHWRDNLKKGWKV